MVNIKSYIEKNHINLQIIENNNIISKIEYRKYRRTAAPGYYVLMEENFILKFNTYSNIELFNI